MLNTYLNGKQIHIEMDLGPPDELYQFYFSGGSDCLINAVERDFVGDDRCSARGNIWGIIKPDGRLSDPIAYYYGGCASDAKTVIEKPFGSRTGISCDSCPILGDGYKPKGEIMCASDGIWYLCDSTYHYGKSNRLFIIGGNDYYECTTSNQWIKIDKPCCVEEVECGKVPPLQCCNGLQIESGHCCNSGQVYDSTGCHDPITCEGSCALGR